MNNNVSERKNGLKYELTYGREKISLEAPEGFAAGPLIKPKISSVMSGAPGDIISQALAYPKNRPALSELVQEQRVGLVVSDELRVGLQEQIISCLLGEIAKGRPREVFVFIATGSHHPEIYARNIMAWIHRYASALKLSYQVFPNFCEKEKEYVFLGNTSYKTPVYIHKKWLTCTVRIHGHEAKYHYMNGYSCIDKHIVPGLAFCQSIEQNHKLALHHHDAVAGKNSWHKDPNRQNNPFSQDNREARAMSEKVWYNENTDKVEEQKIVTFALDMVSQKEQIFWLDCGDPDIVCREVTEAVDTYLGFTVEKTKYLVVSPGGPPTCDTIYYVQNSFDMVIKGALTAGGQALVMAPCCGTPAVSEAIRGICPDEESMKLFWHTLLKYLPQPLSVWQDYVADNFKLFMWKTDRVLKLFKESGIKIYLYSQLKDEVVSAGGFIPEHDPQRWISERAERHDGKIRFVDEANKLCVMGI